MGQEREQIMEAAKKKSRYGYLEKRETTQIDLYKKRVEDEQKMFEGVELTKQEILVQEINKKTLEFALN